MGGVDHLEQLANHEGGGLEAGELGGGGLGVVAELGDLEREEGGAEGELGEGGVEGGVTGEEGGGRGEGGHGGMPGMKGGRRE